jgi:hypothetical protein
MPHTYVPLPNAAVGTLDLCGFGEDLNRDVREALERRDQWWSWVEEQADHWPDVRVSHVGAGDNCWLWCESCDLMRAFIHSLTEAPRFEFSGAWGCGTVWFRDAIRLGRIEGPLVVAVSREAERGDLGPWEIVEV